MAWEHVITADAQSETIWTTRTDGGGGAVSRNNTYARTGTYSWFLPTNTQTGVTVASNAEKYFSFSWLSIQPATTQIRFKMRESTTVHVTLLLNTVAGTLRALRGTEGGTQIASCSGVGDFAWLTLDCYVKIHDTEGRLVVKDSNGGTLIDFTGDTQNGGSGVVDNLIFDNEAASYRCYVDDFAVRTDAYCGPGGNYALAVTGAGANTAWTPSAGANYACVDEIPATFTDYVATDASVNATKDNYAATALPVTASSIAVVAVYALAQLDAAGSGSMRTTIKSSTSYGNGATTALDTTAVWVKGFFDVDPVTSAAWLQADLDDAQPGIETVA